MGVMPSRAISAAVTLLGCVWGGLLVGLFTSSWAHTMTIAIATGVVIACLNLWSYDCPASGIHENWKELTHRERRMILRALWRGEIVEQRSLTALTIRAAEAIAAAPRASRRSEVFRHALGIAVVVAAAFVGAPTGWVLAGAAAIPAVALLQAYADEPARERARRAAAVNRARLTAPEGVPAGVRGVRA
jgi:hypothetical protein